MQISTRLLLKVEYYLNFPTVVKKDCNYFTFHRESFLLKVEYVRKHTGPRGRSGKPAWLKVRATTLITSRNKNAQYLLEKRVKRNTVWMPAVCCCQPKQSEKFNQSVIKQKF